jgi:hypothetical protein
MEQEQEAAHTAGQDAAPNDTRAPAVSSITPLLAKPDQDGEGGEGSDVMSTSDWIMSIATIVIAVGTLVSAGAICMQYMEMHEGGVQTDRIIAADERIASAMEGTLGEAKRSLDAAINQNRLDQRAWVGPIEMGINDPPVHVGSKLVATVVLTNNGKTPALDVATLASIEFVDKGTVLNPHYKIDKTDQSSKSVIQPGMKEMITTLPVGSPTGSGAGTVSAGDLAEIQSGGHLSRCLWA